MRYIIVFFASFILFSCTQEESLHEDRFETDFAQTEQMNSSGVSKDVALYIARKHLFPERARTANVSSTIQVVKSNEVPVIYIINYQNGGFALVSAKKTYYPILAYSRTGTFPNISKLNPELRFWLDNTSQFVLQNFMLSDDQYKMVRHLWNCYLGEEVEIVSSRSSGTSAHEAYAKRTHEIGLSSGYSCMPLSSARNFLGASYDYYVNIANQYNSPLEFTIVAFKNSNYTNTTGPLMTTTWDQKNGFNSLSRPDGSATGCVTIAMAQIMKYFQYPPSYNWSNMPDSYASYDTQLFIKDVTESLHIVPGSDSGATIDEAYTAFRDRFHYNVTMKAHKLEDVKKDILLRKPVYMRGQDVYGQGGHAWVCDGYEEQVFNTHYFVEYRTGNEGSYRYESFDRPHIDSPEIISSFHETLHMNWGWNGKSNGWFHWDDVSPDNYDFSINRQNLYLSIP